MQTSKLRDREMGLGRGLLSALLAGLLVGATTVVACGGTEGGGGEDDSSGADVSGGAEPEVVETAVEETAVADADDAQSADTEEVQEPEGPTWTFEVQVPLGQPPPDPAAATGRESCPIYLEERCKGGKLQRCSVWSSSEAATGDGYEEPGSGSVVERTFLFERWYDLYHQPDGQTANRNLAGPTPPGTPEGEWGFSGWDAIGDSAIWTGTGLHAYILRYLVTGTAADEERMLTKVRKALAQFDVTGVPGYLSRHHWLQLEAGGPQSDQHILKHGEPAKGLRDHVVDSDLVDFQDLPSIYQDGYVDEEGTVWEGTPMWHGKPSIDQYSGPFTAFAMAYHLMPEDLQERVVHHITCYLKRLKRMEIINLQENPDALDSLVALLSGPSAQLDEGDIDFQSLERIVIYYHAQLNSKNHADFDRSCPDTLELEADRIIDAVTDESLFEGAFQLYLDYEAEDVAQTEGIDHYYAVSISGPHALTLTWLGVLAYYLTGDEQYRSFVTDELLGELRALEVAYVTGAFILPRWCRKFYADHILFVPVWNLLTLLADGELKSQLQQVVEVELWQKVMHDVRNLEFDGMYAATIPAEMASGRQQALEELVGDLGILGANTLSSGGPVADPRRSYNLERQEVLDALPEDIEPVCPSEDQRAACEAGTDLFGIELPGATISYACDGRPAECTMEDGLCTEAWASAGLPADLRPYEGYMWEGGSPRIGRGFGADGAQQSPGLDVIEPYWLARYYGFSQTGAGWVLAWQTLADPPEGACE